ncbi:CG2 omega domain protein [Photobacterium sp. SDRW27]|uniref:CG2 omega domain protein n=1 Tax=Photobacterium obscurum TaxID=2829490 RepID=UPI002243651C|nr:CG2 omega domain protein [Photobacterium obscurum]MCW8328791.1 CG2 omega domain protein [Photobacterium obscurum]
MKKWLAIIFFLSLGSAQADVKISGDGFELSKDCLKLESDNVKISSEECEEWKKKNKGNSSVHGDNNPGQGNKKDQKGKKNNK